MITLLANLQSKAIRALQGFCVSHPAFTVLMGIGMVIGLGIGFLR